MYWKVLASTLVHILGLAITSRLWNYITSEPKYQQHQQLYIGAPPQIPFYDSPVEEQIPASQPPSSRLGVWLGWGADVYNNRWAATDTEVDVANVASLSLTCQKPYSPGVSAPPLVADGVAYYPTWSGLLVALDYKSCRTLWQTNVTRIIKKFKPLESEQALTAAVSRTTPAVDGGVLFIGTLANALVLAIDKSNGRLIDSVQLSTHPFATITQSPTFYKGKLYVGVSSLEEGAVDVIPNYVCCTFVGTMNALTLRYGRLRLAWTTPTIPVNLNFSGAAVWGSQPAIDPIRSQVFIATGNTYFLPQEFQLCQNQTANISVIQTGEASDPCLPRNVLQNSVIALDLATGRINWARQLSPIDAWNAACVPGLVPGSAPNPASCPAVPGPDADFGIAPTFVLGSEFTPFGLDIVTVGQKNGNIYALSASAGTLLWSTATSPDGLEGGLIWGMASDDKAVYFTAVNSNRMNYTLMTGTDKGKVISNSAFGALSFKDGSILWQTTAPRNTSSLVPPTVVNDVVLTGVSGNFTEGTFGGTGPGSFIPLDKTSGRILKEFHLDSHFRGGIATVHDYVMFGTGYGGAIALADGSFQVWKLGKETRVIDADSDENHGSDEL
jgi:outer membrane protein assembly factor BamB